MNNGIVFVNPSLEVVYESVNDKRAIEPPWVMTMMASYTSKVHPVHIVDQNALNITNEDVSNIIKFKDIDSVLVSAIGHTPNGSTQLMPAVKGLVSEIRAGNPDVRIGLMGAHPAQMQECTIGETGVDVCLDTLPPQIAGIDHIRWDLLPMENYRAHNWHAWGFPHREGYAAMYTGIGCPHDCEYCSVRTLWSSSKHHKFDVKFVIRELEILASQYGVRHVKIIDDLFIPRNSLIDAIHATCLDFNFWYYARLDQTPSKTKLKKMEQAGFNWVCLGIEGYNDPKFGSEEKVREVVQRYHDQGVNVLGNFLLGHPDDTKEDFKKLTELAITLDLEYANFSTMFPYPGTQQFENFPRADWESYFQYGYYCRPLPTAHCSPGTVLAWRDFAAKIFFMNPDYHTLIEKRFGQAALGDVLNMKKSFKRKILGD